MINAIKHWLKLAFHFHEWDTIEVNTARTFEYDSDHRPIETRRTFIQQCKVCGKLRKVSIKI